MLKEVLSEKTHQIKALKLVTMTGFYKKIRHLWFDVVCTVHHIAMWLMANEMHNSYNKYFIHSFLSAVRVSNESSRSS